MHNVAFAQGRQGGLHHADVSLHAAKQDGIAVSRQPLEAGAKYVAAEAGEGLFIDGQDAGEQGSDLWNRVPKRLCVLSADEVRNFEQSGDASQELAILDQPVFLENWRQQLFLKIDHEQCTLLRNKRLPRNLRGVIDLGGDVADRSDHDSPRPIAADASLSG